MDIQLNLTNLNQRIREYEALYSRPPHSVMLLAASKGQSLEKMQSAIEVGQHMFGENYIQEALPKMSALSHYPLEWHFIGAIQRNKTKKIAEYFDWVQSVSNKDIAERLNAERPSHLPPLNICLEVNVSHESSKSGMLSSELIPLAEYCQKLPRLRLRGLMAIPAFKNSFEEQCAELKKLKLLFDDLKKNNFNIDTLSMGMSNDMQAAIAEGTTMVRIGTALFGPRK